jgi:hypothetical protein
MKTTHELARELLTLPDVPLVIEMWCRMDGHEMAAEMTEYDPAGTAIIWQRPISFASASSGSAPSPSPARAQNG